MNLLLLVSFLFFGSQGHFLNGNDGYTIAVNKTVSGKDPAQELSISFPKNNQKVRGIYKIYGKAKPGTVVELLVSQFVFQNNA